VGSVCTKLARFVPDHLAGPSIWQLPQWNVLCGPGTCVSVDYTEYIDGPINLYGLEEDVDVMIESKGKELALLEYRQYIIDGGAVGPRTARVAKFAAAAAAAAAAAQEDDGSEEEKDGDTASVDCE